MRISFSLSKYINQNKKLNKDKEVIKDLKNKKSFSFNLRRLGFYKFKKANN